MTTKLKAKDPALAEPSRPKIVVYGSYGTGKTWGALSFPKAYFIDSEGGANLEDYQKRLKASGGSYMGPEDGALDFSEVISQVKILSTEKHNYRTLIIDSVSKLYNSAAAIAAENGGDDYGRDKKEANKPVRRLISALDRLDMNVILIAHEIPLWGLDGKGNRCQIGTQPDVYEKLMYELHLCLQITKQGGVRKATVKKKRLAGFKDGDSFDWTTTDSMDDHAAIDAFVKRMGHGIIDDPVRVITLATPEQVEDMKRLIDLLKVDSETIQKWLEKSNAEKIEELNTDQASKVIEHLKSKIK